MGNHIPLEECKDGFLYRLFSRNLAYGVYKVELKGFIGIREKFGNKSLDSEFHYDTGAPFGTVFPKELLEECPIKPLNVGYVEGGFFHVNKPLFEWLQEKEKQYTE